MDRRILKTIAFAVLLCAIELIFNVADESRPARLVAMVLIAPMVFYVFPHVSFRGRSRRDR
jgi:hypothetical protein